jgi:hypothetical protein
MTSNHEVEAARPGNPMTGPAPLASQSRCKLCPERIAWAITKNGKRLPVDPHPNPAGNVQLFLGRPLFAKVHAGPPGMLDDWTAYMPHHATCTGVNK